MSSAGSSRSMSNGRTPSRSSFDRALGNGEDTAMSEGGVGLTALMLVTGDEGVG